MRADRIYKDTNTTKENEFCVIVKLKSQVNNLRLTYSKKIGGKLIEIEEINAAEARISGCKFKGRSSSGDCPDDIKKIKPLLGSISPTEWIRDNQDLMIDAYHRIH